MTSLNDTLYGTGTLMSASTPATASRRVRNAREEVRCHSAQVPAPTSASRTGVSHHDGPAASSTTKSDGTTM